MDATTGVTLKLDHWPTLADRHLAATQAGRRALLATTVDRAPLPLVTAATAWTSQRACPSCRICVADACADGVSGRGSSRSIRR
jgi:hypothetical protein